jgi:hypothetical protein
LIVLTTLDSGRVLLRSRTCPARGPCRRISAIVVSGKLRHHVHDLVAAGLKLAQQFRHRFRVAGLKSCISRMPLPFFASLVITDLITASGL